MRCIECGAEMRMLQVARDDTMMVSGYEHHTLECADCHNVERRLVFSRAKRSLTGRNVQIVHDPDKATYAATDIKSGLVVMRHQDSARLRVLCDWIGWYVVDDGSGQRQRDDESLMRAI
jgi:hypothetical protein